MEKRKSRLKNLVWVLALCLAVAGMVYGLGREEWRTVLTKAVNICFQCIGLG